MNFLISMGYVNRPDLLYKAIYSIPSYWPHLVVVDNSPERDLRKETWIPKSITVYEPPVPLTFSQKMNLMQNLAREKKCDVVMYMHNDAEAHEGTPEAVLSLIESLNREGRKWGAIFTNFDILSAFNMEAVNAVGPWDTNLPQYFSDVDFYRRIVHAGYEHIWTGLGVTHHNDGMMTLKSDDYLRTVNQVTWPLYQEYFEAKWGLTFKWLAYQEEGHRIPFDNKDLFTVKNEEFPDIDEPDVLLDKYEKREGSKLKQLSSYDSQDQSVEERDDMLDKYEKREGSKLKQLSSYDSEAQSAEEQDDMLDRYEKREGSKLKQLSLQHGHFEALAEPDEMLEKYEKREGSKLKQLSLHQAQFEATVEKEDMLDRYEKREGSKLKQLSLQQDQTE